MRRATAIACAAAALLGFAWGPVLGLPADAAPRTAPSWAEDYDPCVYEDGSGGDLPCYWDAGNRGNGRGCSYLILSDGSTDYSAAQSVNHPDCQTKAGRARLRARGGAAPAPFCQYDAYRHEVGVTGYNTRPGATVAIRVNGRTFHGKLDGNGYTTFRLRGVYTQEDVRAYVNGHRCEGT